MVEDVSAGMNKAFALNCRGTMLAKSNILSPIVLFSMLNYLL